MATENFTTTENKPDWTIEELYRNSWQIVKNNKILWIFAAAAGGGFSLNNSIRFNADDLLEFQNLFNGKTIPEPDTFGVLGAASFSFASLFSAVPVWFYILLAVELILFFLIAIVIAVVYQNWANGALLENIQTCINGGKATIREASEKAFGYIKPLIWLQIVPGFLLAITTLAVFGVLTMIVITVDVFIIKVIAGLLMFLAILTAIYTSIMLGMSLIWAPRMAVSDKKPALESLKSAYKIARKKIWASLLLGIVNNFLGAAVIIIPIFLLLGLGILGWFIGNAFEQSRIILFLLGSLLFLVFIIALIIGSAVLTAFKATVWSLAYNKIKGKYDF